MKKLEKLLALLLAGVMMLSMAACSGGSAGGGVAFNETEARKMIMEEINACYAKYHKNQLTEYPQLDKHAAAYLKQFQEKNMTIMKYSETRGDEVVKCWNVAEKELKANIWFGIARENINDGTDELRYRLTGKLPDGCISREEIKKQIENSKVVKEWKGDGVGIAFTRIDGELYWFASFVVFK